MTPTKTREQRAREALRIVQSRRSCDVPSNRVVTVQCAVEAIIAAEDAVTERCANIAAYEAECLNDCGFANEREAALRIEAGIRNPEGEPGTPCAT